MSLNQIRHFKQVTPNIASSGQPLASQFKLIAANHYQTVINLAPPEHAESLFDETEIVLQLGMRYSTIPVPFEAPTIDHLQQFFAAMQAASAQKVWVHCILNYRVSAFLFHYLQHSLHYDARQAKASVFKDWQPDHIWQQVWDWPITNLTSHRPDQ